MADYWQKLQSDRTTRRRFLRGTAIAGVGTAATAFLAACGGSSDNKSASGGSPAASSTSSTGDSGPLASSQVLKVRYYDDPGGFDPATLFRVEVENIAFNVYSGLTSYEPDKGKIIPDLAESWEVAPDGLSINFKLVKNAKFHKGFGAVTSDDVVWSYKRIIDPATASTYKAEYNNVDNVIGSDPYTVQIKLKRPDANFLHQVANYHQGQVLSKAAVEKFGADYKFNPIGTGPFFFDKFTPAQQILLTRNDEYFKKPPTLEKIDFRIIKDDNTGAIALQNGEVDLAMRIADAEPLGRVMKDSRFTMNTRAGYAVNLTIFNVENQYLKDQRLRYAYAYAVDRDTVIKTTAPLTSLPWYNLIPDWMDVYTADVPKYPYDVAKAKQLLSAAGFPNGFTLKQPTLAVTDATQLTQSYLDKVGIKSDFQVMDTPTYNGVRTRGEFDVSGRLTPAINPDTIFFSYLHPDNIAPKGLNGARYNNPDVTKTLESARAEPDFEKRKALYGQVQKQALTDLPYLPTTNAVVFWPGYKYVTGVKINPLSQVGFYDVKIMQH